MTDRIGRALGQIVADNARKQRTAVTRTPRTGSGQTLPPPPVLSPVVNRAANIGSVARQAASTPGVIPPPPILTMPSRLGQRAAETLPSSPIGSLGVATTPVRMPGIYSTVGEAVSRTARSGGQEWGVYSVDGVNVAMPSVLARHNGFSVPEGVHEPTSDPELVENLRSSSISYDKMPEEVSSKIRMPGQVSLGRNLSEQAKQVKQEAEVAALPEKAQMLTDFAISATTNAMEDAATIMSPEWQAEHEFALVMHRENGTTHLIPRKELRSATDPETGQFNTITNSVSREEAASMVAAGAIDPDTRMTVPTGNVDSTLAEQFNFDRNYDTGLQNRRLMELALSQEGVVEIDGKHYPEGTTEPVPVAKVTGFDLQGEGETVTEDLPPAAEGWTWVHDGEQAWMVPLQLDNNGNAIVPRGAARVRTREEATDTFLNQVEDLTAETALWALETVIVGATSLPARALPQKAKDAWDQYIQEPATNWLLENMPEGRLRDTALIALENPLLGALMIVNYPGESNIDLITQSVLYPGESALADKLGWQRHVPAVKQYVEFVEANPDEARNIYENGYDSDGDGEVDTYGSEAVSQWWYDEDLAGQPGGSSTWIMFGLVTDPFTYLFGGGLLFKGGSSVARTRRMNASTPKVQRAWRVIEKTSDTVGTGFLLAEDIASLGMNQALNLVGPLSRRLWIGGKTSSALASEALSDARSVFTETGTEGAGNVGTLEVDRRTGDVVLVPDQANAPTTGPLAREAGGRAVVDPVELERLQDEAFGLSEGDTVNVGRGQTATKTADGWEVTTPTGETVGGTTRAAAVQAVEDLETRWQQWPIEEGRDPRYIDQMPGRLYDEVRTTLGDEWNESVAIQRASDTPGSDVPNIRHLNESDRIAWRTIEVAQSIDPTYNRRWERNFGGGDTLYELSEVFRRADLETAMQYWEAMTGGGNTVPLTTRPPFSGTSPIVSLRAPRSNATAGSRSVRMANAAVDNVYARLKWNPGDVYDPRFADIVRQAANLDHTLRERGLRTSGPDWTYEPLVSLIPDDAPIRLRKQVRDMAAYEAPEVRVDDAGEFIARFTLHKETGLGVDVYRVTVDQVPEPWLNYWIEQMPEVQGQQYWAQGVVERNADEGFTVYAPDTMLAIRTADETALARGWTDFDAPERAIDHVQNVEGPQRAVSAPARSVGDSVDQPQRVTVTRANAGELNRISTPRSGYEWTEVRTTPSGRPVYEQVKPGENIGFARAFGSSDEIIDGRLHVRYVTNPQRTGWEILDGGSVVEWIDAGDLVVENGVAGRANKEQVYISADRYLDSQQGTTGQDVRSPQQAVESPESVAVPEVESVPAPDAAAAPSAPEPSLAARIRALLDEVEGIEPEGTVPTETVASVPDRMVTDADIVQAEQSRVSARAEIEARTSGSDPLPGLRVPEPTGETMMDPTGTIEMPVRQIGEDLAAPEPQGVIGTPEAQRIFDELMALPEDSPRLRAIEKKAGKPTADTSLMERDFSSGTSNSDMYWLGRPLEKYQHDALTAHPFLDGETLKDRTTRYYVEEGNKAGWTGMPQDYLETAMNRAYRDYQAHIIENVYPPGVLPQWAKRGIKKLPKPIQDLLEIAAAMLRLPLKAFDRYSQWIRQRILFHPLKIAHYPSVQYFGNHMLNLLAGDMRVALYMSDPRNAYKANRRVRAGDIDGWVKDGGPMTRSQQMNARLGLESIPETRDVLRGRAIGRQGDHLIGGKFLTENFGRTGQAASFFVAGSKLARDFGAAGDVIYREAIEVSSMHRHIKRTLPDYRNAQLNRMVEDWGLTMPEARQLWKGFEDSLGSRWEFSPDDVRRYFSAEGRLPRGYAERMARDWRVTLKDGQKFAREQVRMRAMAQPQTRADLVAQRLMAFHFFQTRQMWFMVNQMTNHPFMINLYLNAMEELERIAEREGYPEYLTNWIKVFTGPGGRQLFLSPTALYQAYWLFDESDTFRYDQDGKHRNLFERWLKDYTGIDFDLRMFGVNPGLENLVNLGGWSGDTWAPDLTGYGRDANILTLVINTGRMYGLWGDDPTPRGNWLDDKIREVREWVSDVNPWADEVEARSSEQTMDREIRAIMLDELAKDGIDPESEEAQLLVAEAELNPDSDLYQRAIKRWIHGEWFEVGTRLVAGPFRPRYRIGDRSDGDLMTSFGEQARRTLNTPEPMVIKFRQQAGGYYELGDMRANKGASIWNEIANGEVKGDITVNGVTYTEDEINSMTFDQRKAIANGYMAELGLLDDIHGLWDARGQFLAQPENREFAQFDQWRTAVYGYDGGPEQYWEDLIKNNPTAAAYYNAFIRDEDDPRARRRMMTGQNAFFAIKGWDTYVFDKPTEAYASPNEIWDPVGIANTQAQSTPYQEANAEYRNEVREAPVFLAEYQNYDSHVRRKMAEMGYNPNVSFKTLPSRDRTAIENALKDEGIYEPKPSYGTKDFLEWLEKQPYGRYQTLEEAMEAYFAEDQAEYYSRLPGQTEEKVRMPQPVPGPNSQGTVPPSNYGSADDFWDQITSILNEHDHTTYKNPWGRP